MSNIYFSRNDAGEPIKMVEGEGFYRLLDDCVSDEWIDLKNKSMGHSVADVEAARACSMFDHWSRFDQILAMHSENNNDVYEQPVCVTCGASGEHIAFEANVQWCPESHVLTVIDLFDKGHYFSVCDRECRVEWVSVADNSVEG